MTDGLAHGLLSLLPAARRVQDPRELEPHLALVGHVVAGVDQADRFACMRFAFLEGTSRREDPARGRVEQGLRDEIVRGSRVGSNARVRLRFVESTQLDQS